MVEINLKTDLHTIIRLLGGDNFHYVRDYTKEESDEIAQQTNNDYRPYIMTKRLSEEEIVKSTQRYFNYFYLNYGVDNEYIKNTKIYLMGIKFVDIDEYVIIPSCFNYGICIAPTKEYAINLFKNFIVKNWSSNREELRKHEVVILGEIDREDIMQATL